MSLIFLFIQPSGITQVIEEVPWKLIKEEERFAIYGRKLHESKFKEIKVTGQINCAISELVLALEDIDYQKQWILRTIDAYSIEKLGIGKYYFYLSTDMPFPIKDRDLVVYYERTQHPESKVVKTVSKSAPDYVPHVDEFIRVPFFDSYYLIKPLPNGTLDMEYYLKIDPGGALPVWLVNLAASTGPNRTMNDLYELIESGKYKGQSAEGIID